MHKRTMPISNPHVSRFNFAGFQWPRYVARLERGSLKSRMRARRTMCTGEYYHAPKPGNSEGVGFYLGSDSTFRLRYELTGPAFYCDEHGDGTIQGVVFTLPGGRGFLAGWTMGENMASSIDYDIFDNADDARRAAESRAESAAESQREYDAEENARLDDEESQSEED
jgi:hypothetical protein